MIDDQTYTVGPNGEYYNENGELVDERTI